MATTAELQTRLANAEAALDELMTGRRVVSVGYDGKQVTYSQTNMGALRAYIADLKRQLGIGGRAGPIGVVH